jgi:hypothetical protein
MVKGYTVIKTYKITQDDKHSSIHSFRDVSDVLTIGAQDFVTLGNKNGNLMTMFKPGAETKPFLPKALLSIIKDARNAKTDDIMAKHLQASDPMSEQAATLPTDPTARAKLFHESKVPAVISISMCQYMTDDGDVIAPCELKVTSHPKHLGVPAIELIDANLEWLGMMCSRTYADSGDDAEGELADLLEMVKTWLPDDVSIVPNLQKGKQALPYYQKNRRNARVTMRAVAIGGLVSHDLKEYIDEQVLELLKKADGKQGSDSAPSAKSSAPASASGSRPK